MSKIRRIDWSPDEWTAGTSGFLTQRETGVYIVVLMAIYSRGGECPNDTDFINSRFKPESPHHQSQSALTMHTRRALDRLIELGKLQVTPDGQWLTNGRADVELNKARERIQGTVRAGIISGRARRHLPTQHPTQSPPNPPPKGHPSRVEMRETNDLTRTRVRNHQPSTIKDHESTDLTISTGAARDPAPDQTAPGRAPAKRDLEALAAIARAKLLKGQP